MERLPDAVFILDTKKEHIGVTEANKLGIPIIAVVDTNCDPDVIQYVIPGNDDAIRSGSLMCRVIADAVEEGRFIANKRNPAPPPPVERTPEEIAEFEAAQTAARAAAAQAQADRDARLAAAKEQSAVATETVATEPVAPEAVATETVAPESAAAEASGVTDAPVAADEPVAADAPAEAVAEVADEASTENTEA
jgi:small subunit ribosomal protein S2